MNYEEFVAYIRDHFASFLVQQETGVEERFAQEDFLVSVVQVCKNNGIILDGISVQYKGEPVSPSIYLNQYYEKYQLGYPLVAVLEDMVNRYLEIRSYEGIPVINHLDFDGIKDKVIVRLVNYERNKEQLEDCPFIPYLDLAITFRILVGKDPMGMASALVGNREFKGWEISLEDLYELALSNTMREFSWCMDSLATVIVNSLKQRLPEHTQDELVKEIQLLEKNCNGVTMFVLSNEDGLNGATSILYDSVIRDFARVQDCNVFVLPSSVHEVMLVPESSWTDPKALKELIHDANQSSVGLIDLLSDELYYYDREGDQILCYDV